MPHPPSKSLALFLAAALYIAVGAPAARAADDVATRIHALNALLAEQWQWQLQQSPEFATAIGDYRYNDRWSDISLAHVAVQKRDTEAFLERFKAIDTTGFAEQDRLNQQLMVRQLRDNLRAIALKTYEMPLDQFTGVHLQLAQFVAILPFDSTGHYEDYVARLNQVPALFDQLIGVLKQGEKDGLMPPKFLLEKVVTQCRAISAPAGEASAFGQPVAKFPDAVPAADRARLHDAVIAAVDGKVRPAYLKLADFVEKEYAPKGRTGLGLWALSDGEQRYRFAIGQLTTTDLAPAKIHALGLSEVARIEAEQDAIAKKLGYKDLAAFRAELKTDPKIRPTSREQILDLYRKYIAQMEPKLPQLFGLLPKAKLEVLPVETFREKEASAAQYTTGTPDGSRPGKVWVNTGDFEHRNLLEVESTAYHEGVPGHHMQLSIAQELPSLPPFRQQAGYTAYVEGWALYSERLGKEVGFYTDPYSDYGRLCDELLRADRLVLDTGVHAMRWTRPQMVDYFRKHSCETEPDIQAETDRYIAWPAQALAYKLGQMKFLELRARAQKDLGDKFDIRAFHDEMLNGGALPLDVLDARTNDWIAAVKAGTAPAHPVAAK